MVQTINRQLDSFFHLNREESRLSRIDVAEGDLNDYISVLTKNIKEAKNRRHFKFRSNDTEVFSMISGIINASDPEEFFYSNTKKIAERLLHTEITTQIRHRDFSELQKGSLIISLFSDDLNIYILISKIEHESFLDSSAFKKLSGLPYEKGTLKTCLIQFDKEEKCILDVIVTDSNSKISKYWSETFLELEELKSDELNTLVSFNAIDQFLLKRVKSMSLIDYSMIRNHLITYYRTQSEFNYENMIQAVFGQYTPENENLKINELKMQIENLPEIKKFDRVFTIKADEIKARIRKVYKLNSISELRLTGSSSDLKSLIRSKLINGEKYLQIKVENDEIFELFNFRSN